MLRPFIALISLTCIGLNTSLSYDVDPARFDKEIGAIEQQIASGASRSGEILFIGSSSIRLWDLKKSFPGTAYNNHGFGGSHISDSVHFFERIVTPVKPSAIVFYAGDNDLAGKKTPETVAADFRKFVILVEEKCPECRAVLFIAIKPSTKRWELRDVQKTTNAAIAEMASSNPKVHFVDVWDAMLGPDGTPRMELFVEDGLHMTPAGYEIWTTLVAEKFKAALQQPIR